MARFDEGMDKALQESAITFYDKTILGDLPDICQAALGDTIGDFDGPRLAQVFSNLLNNAAQYRSDAQSVFVDAQGSKKEWIVTVTNFGSEIPAESQRAIFDPLVQLSVSSDQKGPATTSLGLGLFIAREIKVAHGGTIGVASSAKTGTVFTVRLPKARGPVARKAQA
jgi:signal transduction histidine kinase